MKRYIGTLITHLDGKHCGFISLKTITAQDGSPHDLATSQDVFVHQDDCGFALRGGMELAFEVEPDENRGGDALRAVDVNNVVTGELVLFGAESGGSRAITDPRSLYVPPTPAQRSSMKYIAPEAVEKVLVNLPMPTIPRYAEDIGLSPSALARRLLEGIFPNVPYFGEDLTMDSPDSEIDAFLGELEQGHRALGMTAQLAEVKSKMLDFKNVRNTLGPALQMANDEGLLRADLMIPLKYVPDLFTAVPVWYFLSSPDLNARAPDPQVHANTRFMCDLVPSQRWCDTFLMFNRRMRTVEDYKGDLIPLKVLKRMKHMAPLFDYLVILTPYHDVAGQDWQNPVWLRSIDPYVVGFKRGLPFFFILARFSDSGVFPLFPELVADTMAFLRTNMEKLKGFNGLDDTPIRNAYWYFAPGHTGRTGNHCFTGLLGNHLIGHTQELLAAFDSGHLFDWLRSEEGQLPARV